MALAKSEVNDKDKLDGVVAKLRRLSDPAKGLCKCIEEIKNGTEVSVIMPLSLVNDLCEAIFSNSKIAVKDYLSVYRQAEDIYRLLFSRGESSPDFLHNKDLFLRLYEENGPISRGMFDNRFFCTFADKGNFINFIRLIDAYPHTGESFKEIAEYGVLVREYMLSDESYLANLLKVVVKLSNASTDSLHTIIEGEIKNVERMNGIYDIDPVRLMEVEKSINDAASIVNRGYDVLKLLDVKKQQIEEEVDRFVQRVDELEHLTEESISIKADKAKERVEKTLSDFEASEKRAVLVEKDLLLREVFADAENKLNGYRETANAIANTTAVEIAALNKDADRIYQKVNDIVTNDKTVREILKRSSEDKDIVEKFNKLSMLNTHNIDAIGNVSGGVLPSENAIVKTVVNGIDDNALCEERILPVSMFLDTNVEFKERLECVMKEKKRREAEGELFHEKFDDVLIAVMEDANPYLIGPSGCGKTYMVRQIASLLGMEYTDIGYINEEYDILGFVNAAGRYTQSNFYRCYKYGYFAFCDELDNGNSKATVKLNSFLSNGRDSNYSFPGGERVKRHPNFRIICAGNTSGNGADVNYNAREKIEESVQQRLLPIYVDYDNRVEEAILKAYPEWYAFACLFRNATDSRTELGGVAAAGILTTRDTARIRRYLDNGSLSEDKIIDYEFIQTKGPEYLEFLDSCMKENCAAYPKAERLYKLFHERKQAVIGKGRFY